MKPISNKYIKNIPNALSISRFFFLPILGYLAYKNDRTTFGILLIIYSLTDTLDGNIARYLKVTSEYGSKLDSLADDIGNLFMIPFTYLLFPSIFIDYKYLISIVIALFIFIELLKILKAKNIDLHLYSGKLTLAILLFMLIYMSFFKVSNILLLTWSILALYHLIESAIVLIFFKPDGKTKSVFDFIGRKDKR